MGARTRRCTCVPQSSVSQIEKQKRNFSQRENSYIRYFFIVLTSEEHYLKFAFRFHRHLQVRERSFMYKFTEEEINKILMSSPMVLPDNPSQYGLKGNNIKSYFYDFIRKLMLLLNEHFVLIERDKAESILNHDENESSHNDIRKIIGDLQARDTELGNMIANHYSEINLSHDDIKSKITNDISSHNIDKYAHNDLRFEFSEVKNMATNALNFAQGKSKIYPVKDIFEMTNKLNDEMNVGDKFVLLDKNVPDFTLFEKKATEGGTVFTHVDLLMGSVEFLPGESYIYSGYLLVASESGMDTSMLVKNEDFELLELIVSQLDLEFENAVKEIENKLASKESAYQRIAESSESVTLQNKTEHNLGLRASASLVAPNDVPSNFECIVNFRSGESATSFECNGIVFTGDDCTGGKLYPIKNRLYEINIKNVCGALIAKVGACDYAIL